MNIEGILKNHKFATALYRDKSNTTNNSIELPELPEEIDRLVDDKNYRNKFKALIRRGHLGDLLELAAIAATKDKPSRWFATVTSKARWEGTLEWLAKAREVARNAAEVARRILARPDQMKAIYKACWRYGSAVIRRAVTAEETGRDRFKYFNWLCRYER